MDITNFLEDKAAGKIQVIVMGPEQVQIIGEIIGEDGITRKESSVTSPRALFQSRHQNLEAAVIKQKAHEAEMAHIAAQAAAEKVIFDDLVVEMSAKYEGIDVAIMKELREHWPARFAKDFPEVIAAEEAAAKKA